MKGKLLILAGAAVGYVLGTRAGRQRYEDLKGRADALWHDPKVQQRVSDAENAVRTRAPHLQDRISDAATKASDKVKATVHHEDHDASEAELSVNGRPGEQSAERRDGS
ncbi:hypothetical protein CLV30_13233 [Haloactinopolyspora alba]|uniref:YtxH domain-containing protein n=1 Tax=Haloactinopolyspora alba TaxID=648780 RepID=A0A2P8D5C4_9ACTN|nr:YtxH domain-containing protein [Haloactinopolyspora alba]PSK92417.1 hypothetical protein CLV30_13233 [Haloactinopolyspora alba]